MALPECKPLSRVPHTYQLLWSPQERLEVRTIIILFLQMRSTGRRGVDYLVQGHTSFKSWDTDLDTAAAESMLLTTALGFLQVYLPILSMCVYIWSTCVNTNLEACVCVCVYVYRVLLFHLEITNSSIQYCKSHPALPYGFNSTDSHTYWL